MKELKDVKNVAIYLRRSRGEETEDLIKHERSSIQVCEKYGWSYTIYKEIGSGDSIEARPIMCELLDDVGIGLYDAVVVTYYDRLGRGSGTDQDIITNVFLNSNTLIIETTPFTVYNMEDEASEEMLAFKQFMARRDYKNINKKLTHGRKMAVEMGRWVFSSPPYGYDYDRKTKKLEVNDEQAKVLRMIYDMYLNENMSSNDIAWSLNKQQIPSPKNTLWTGATILQQLKAEVTLGHIVYNKTKGNRKSNSTIKKKFEYVPKNEWKTVYNAHPAIKTQEEHERILKTIKENNTHTRKNNVNVLSGVVKCYNCNSTLAIRKASHDGRDEISNCSKCKQCKGGRAEIVMNSIYESTKSIKRTLENVKNDQLKDKEKTMLLKEIEKLDAKLDTQYKAIENIELWFEEGRYSSDKAKSKIKEREEKIYELENIVRKKREKFESFSNMTNTDRIKRLDEFIERMKKSSDENDKAKQNSYIKNIISEIIWKRTEWDEIEVTVNFL